MKKGRKISSIDRDRLSGERSGGQLDESPVEDLWRKQRADEKKLSSLQQKYKNIDEEKKRVQRELRETQEVPSLREVFSAFKAKFLLYFDKFLDSRFVEIIKSGVKKRPKLAITIAAIAAFALGYNIFFVTDNTKDTLGETVLVSDDTSIVAPDDLTEVSVDNLSFDLLYPAGQDRSLYKVLLVSPPGNDPAYSYLDRVSDDGIIINVTQQKVASNFDVAKTADDFQANRVLPVDDNVLFFGFSEKGNVQRVIFVKDEVLTLIRSPKMYADDVWVNYYLSLQK